MLVSVIIPTLGRVPEIYQCLHKLKKQSLQPNEIIVVNDSKVKLQAKGVIIINSKKRLGSAIAKNLGAKIAQGEILVFLDDDSIPAKNWLFEITKFFKNQRIAVVAGRVIEENFSTKRDSLTDLILNLPFYWLYLLLRQKQGGSIYLNGRVDISLNSIKQGYCAWGGAGNLAIRRDFFVEARGFDEKFLLGPNAEEPDLCYRIRKLGGDVFYNGLASVVHHHSAKGRLNDSSIIKALRANEIYFILKNIAFRSPIHFLLSLSYQVWQVTIYFILSFFRPKYLIRIKGKILGIKLYLGISRLAPSLSVLLNLFQHLHVKKVDPESSSGRSDSEESSRSGSETLQGRTTDSKSSKRRQTRKTRSQTRDS